VGIWGNSYGRVFYWGETAAHREYTERISKYLEGTSTRPSWAIQGYTGMQFLIEGDQEGRAAPTRTRSAKALPGPHPSDTPPDRQADDSRERSPRRTGAAVYGKTVKDPK